MLVGESQVVIIPIRLSVLLLSFIMAGHAPAIYFLHDVPFHFLVLHEGHVVELKLLLVLDMILLEPFRK